MILRHFLKTLLLLYLSAAVFAVMDNAEIKKERKLQFAAIKKAKREAETVVLALPLIVGLPI